MASAICPLMSDGGFLGSDMVKDTLVNLCLCVGDELALQCYACACWERGRGKAAQAAACITPRAED